MSELSIKVEHHTENGKLPWVVVLRGGPFSGDYWISSSRTEREARRKALRYRQQRFEARQVSDGDGI